MRYAHNILNMCNFNMRRTSPVKALNQDQTSLPFRALIIPEFNSKMKREQDLCAKKRKEKETSTKFILFLVIFFIFTHWRCLGLQTDSINALQIIVESCYFFLFVSLAKNILLISFSRKRLKHTFFPLKGYP